MKIITLTLSPAFDVHCVLPSFTVGKEHVCKVLRRDLGGKGINVSRALTMNGVENVAVVALGRENGGEFLKALIREGISFQPIDTEGRIRENITVRNGEGIETRISFAGDDAPPTLLPQIQKTVRSLLEDDDILCLSGSVPRGIDLEGLKTWLLHLRREGIRTVIDSRSFTVGDLTFCRPWLIKPNEEEISAYMGYTVTSREHALHAAATLFGEGIENVMVSLGADGAVLVNNEGRFTAIPPRIVARSTIGAGDSSIAGFLTEATKGSESALCLRRAIAFGTAACLSEGTTPPNPENVEHTYTGVFVTKR